MSGAVFDRTSRLGGRVLPNDLPWSPWTTRRALGTCAVLALDIGYVVIEKGRTGLDGEALLMLGAMFRF